MCMVFAYNDCTMSHVDFIYMTVIRQEQLIKIQCDSERHHYLLNVVTEMLMAYSSTSHIQIYPFRKG